MPAPYNTHSAAAQLRISYDPSVLFIPQSRAATAARAHAARPSSAIMHRVVARPVWCALERPVPCYGGALRPRARVWLARSGRPSANRGTADQPARRASPAVQLRTFAAASLATQEPRRSKCGACALQARGLRSVGLPRRQWLACTRSVATCAGTLAPVSSDWSEGTDEEEDDDNFASVTDPVQLLVEAEELADLRHPHKWYVPCSRC